MSQVEDWQLPRSSVDLRAAASEYTNCYLCPRQCGFNRLNGSHPMCGDWNLKVSNYGLSFGDEEVLSKGGGSGIIFLAGCHLDCPSCISRDFVDDHSSLTSPSDFLTLAFRLHQSGANNLQILSPTVHYPALRLILEELRKSGFPLPVILKTSGYEALEEIKKFRGLVDIWLPDYKFMRSHTWTERSGARSYPEVFKECLDEMRLQTGRPVIKENLLRSGTMIRHVRNPYLESLEQEEILLYLKNIEGVHLSILDDFIELE